MVPEAVASLSGTIASPMNVGNFDAIALKGNPSGLDVFEKALMIWICL